MNRETVSVALMLGGNLGDPVALFRQVRAAISNHAGELTAVSRIYLSEPWGMKDQPWFRNQAILLNTTLEPLELLSVLQQMEQQMGREQSERNGPRIIDIDILLYGDRVIHETGLTIPHPRMHLRKFNLEPLSEIAGFRMHPVFKKTISELNAECTDTLTVKPSGNAVQ